MGTFATGSYSTAINPPFSALWMMIEAIGRIAYIVRTHATMAPSLIFCTWVLSLYYLMKLLIWGWLFYSLIYIIIWKQSSTHRGSKQLLYLHPSASVRNITNRNLNGVPLGYTMIYLFTFLLLTSVNAAGISKMFLNVFFPARRQLVLSVVVSIHGSKEVVAVAKMHSWLLWISNAQTWCLDRGFCPM